MDRIQTAVNWWADKLRSCKHSGLSSEERRDPSNSGYQLAEMLMTMNKPKVTEEQIEKFSRSLTAALEGGNGRVSCLRVDYGPDHILGKALQDAEIRGDMGTLPIKTVMWIDDSKIDVRYGYGAPTETIWTA